MNDTNINILQQDNNNEREELIKVQNELKRTYENFLDFFDNAPIGYITLDSIGLIKTTNKFACQLFKLNKYDFIDKYFSMFISKESSTTFFETIKKSFNTGRDQDCELILQSSLGENIYAKVIISTVIDEEKKTKENKISIIDITLQKEAEEKILQINNSFAEQIKARTKELEENNKMLEEARNKAEEMNKMKSLFLSNMSHEFRTPLVGILGFSEVMMVEAKDNSIKEMAALIHSGGTRLLETLNLILDFSEIESEKFILHYELTNVNTVVSDVVNLFSDIIKKNNLKIEYKSENKEIKANIDPRLFKQIVNNLVNNAVKYTNEGSIEVSLSANLENLILKVKDTGIGIEKDKIEGIFEEFKQVSEGFNRRFIGTGLGLTLTKKFIELMNGTIRVISEFNKGTEFIVELPLAPDVTKDDSTNNSLEGMKALIVEDDEISYSLLKNILNDYCETDIATNMQDAINKASEYLYNFVVMDINLGSDDTGIDVTREIRTIEGYHKVPIIAVTAYSMKGDKKFFINSGLDAYVSKPFTKNELIETIKRSIRNISE